jgi:hypothetical protein
MKRRSRQEALGDENLVKLVENHYADSELGSFFFVELLCVIDHK